MLKRSATLMLMLGSTFAAAAFAQSTPNETGMVHRSGERVIVSDKLDANVQARSDWSFVGGDTGWQLRQHAYELRNGRLVDVDSLRHDTPPPRLADDIWAKPDERYRSAG